MKRPLWLTLAGAGLFLLLGGLGLLLRGRRSGATGSQQATDNNDN